MIKIKNKRLKKINKAIENLGFAISNAKFDGAAEGNAVKDKFNDLVNVTEKLSAHND